MNYESKINLLPDGRVEVITKGKGRESIFNPHLEQRTEEARYKYNSIDELRESIVQEKFHTEILEYGAAAMTFFGFSLIGAAAFENDIVVKLVELFSGIPIGVGGPRFQVVGEKNKPKVDSRVEAFNKSFQDIKPVRFSPRDYLSTIHIPFRH